MSCVILLFMKDMVSFLGKFSVATSTITDEALSFILFYSSVQDVLYSYRPKIKVERRILDTGSAMCYTANQ